jgi:hypothetical protein
VPAKRAPVRKRKPYNGTQPRNEPRPVPSHPESEYSFSHDLFTPIDVSLIAAKAGLRVPAEDRVALCAWLLNEHFLQAVCAADRDQKTAPAAVLRKHFAKGEMVPGIRTGG